MKLFIFCSLLGFASAIVLQHSLSIVKSRRTKIMKTGMTYHKQKQFLRPTMPLTNSKFVSQNIFDTDDVAYVVDVTIGTPDQTFRLILDTGSSVFWVPDVTSCLNTNSSCQNYCSDQAFCEFLCDPSCCKSIKTNQCLDGNLFNSSESSTYVSTGKNLTIGSMAGIIGEDIVRFGQVGSEQLIIPKTLFGQVTNPTDLFDSYGADGVLGLGFQSNETDSITPPLINAINQGLLDKPLFTVYLEKHGLAENSSGGLITYGAIDTHHCSSNIDYHPLTSTEYYQFKMDFVSVGSYNSSEGWDVISDTGTAFIGGPPTIIQNIIDELGGTYDSYYGVYMVNCSATIPSVTFTIGGIQYPIDGKQIINNIGDDKCILALFSFDSGSFGPSWIFGSTWIRAYCNIYGIGDKNIGFAKVIV